MYNTKNLKTTIIIFNFKMDLSLCFVHFDEFTKEIQNIYEFIENCKDKFKILRKIDNFESKWGKHLDEIKKDYDLYDYYIDIACSEYLYIIRHFNKKESEKYYNF
jgi:hypothetical protein